ncbi:MAG: hypothetical protein WDA20_12585 [Desulfuromonadales bacterium]
MRKHGGFIGIALMLLMIPSLADAWTLYSRVSGNSSDGVVYIQDQRNLTDQNDPTSFAPVVPVDATTYAYKLQGGTSYLQLDGAARAVVDLLTANFAADVAIDYQSVAPVVGEFDGSYSVPEFSQALTVAWGQASSAIGDVSVIKSPGGSVVLETGSASSMTGFTNLPFGVFIGVKAMPNTDYRVKSIAIADSDPDNDTANAGYTEVAGSELAAGVVKTIPLNVDAKGITVTAEFEKIANARVMFSAPRKAVVGNPITLSAAGTISNVEPVTYEFRIGDGAWIVRGELEFYTFEPTEEVAALPVSVRVNGQFVKTATIDIVAAGDVYNQVCLGCHTGSTPAVIEAYYAGTHGGPGALCAACHTEAPHSADELPTMESAHSTIDASTSCAQCHGSAFDGAALGAAHAITGVVEVGGVQIAESGADLVMTYNLKVDGANAAGFTTVNRDYRFDGVDRLDLGEVTAATDLGGGNYSVILPGAATNGNSRYLLRVQNAAGTRALVMADYPAAPVADLATDQACVDCHGNQTSGFHYSYPVGVAQCVVCHDAANTTYPRLPELIHGIHNSHNMPSGQYVLDAENTFSVTYPTYMTDCSVCHRDSQLTAVNDRPLSYDYCMSCHANWLGYGDDDGVFQFGTVTVDHNGFVASTDCTLCHNGFGAATFHNGIINDPAHTDGLIWNGANVSVAQGARIDMRITGITRIADADETPLDDNAQDSLAITWTASLDGSPIDPCNTTVASAPIFHAGGAADSATGQAASNLSFLRAYGQGDDWVNAEIATTPGQPVSTNVTTTNTVCAANVATTTIALSASEQATTALKGVVALQGKPQVALPYIYNAPLGTKNVIPVRAKTPTREFVVASGELPAQLRREITDTAACLKCHVGSLYQHGGNRVDNVEMCILCHNEASSEQNVRVDYGVDAAEAYDGKPGQTYGFKSMLHAIHSAGETGEPIVFYRSRGIYAWAADESVLPNWPGTGAQVIYGSTESQTHNFHRPTYPRALNDCAACHKPGTEALPDQTRAVATTVDAGLSPWENQLDDTLKGPAAAACMSCHHWENHASQFGFAPTDDFTRADILNQTAGTVESCANCHQ